MDTEKSDQEYQSAAIAKRDTGDLANNKRRKEYRANSAIVISILALLVSVLSNLC